MPIYSYTCKAHGDFEKMQKISARETAPCPTCHEVCSQQITAPKMVQGGYMDRSMKFSKKF